MGLSQHRGVVVARRGVAAASQPLAVSAGLGVLQGGGSFADAAIATSAVLCVTEPQASHIGGDMFAILYDGATGQTAALNGSGAAPEAATLERLGRGIPIRGMPAVAVPGLVDGWAALHGRWGRLPLAQCLEPAIYYAERGYPASFRTSRAFAASAPALRDFPHSLQSLTGGALPQPGETVRQPDLAWTLRQIAEGGRDAFYQGEIAARIVRHSRERGGLLGAEDLAAHRTQVSAPIRVDYRGFTVHGQPPVSQGIILLEELNLVEGYPLAEWGPDSPDTTHVQVEAKKLAFADRHGWLGDPRFVDVPLDGLLSKAYADERREFIRLDRAAEAAASGSPPHDTTYFCVADESGSAVSFIQSVFWHFGSCEVAEGTGVLLNNRMTGFSLDPRSPNVLAPGKRTIHTLNAYLVTKRGADGRHELSFVGGTPGADIQVQSNLQVICSVVDFGMNPQQAVEAARWQHGPAVEPGPDVLAIEDRAPAELLEELERRGHRVEMLPPWGHGSSYQLLARDPATGAYLAGSDPRCDGHAAGF